jgi:hypothetical protein
LLANIADAKVAAAAKAQVAFSGDRSSLMALFEAWAGACESRDVDLANYGLTMLNSAGTTLLADATGLEKAKIEKRIATAQARVEATAKASGGSAVVAGGSLVAHLERVNGLKPTVLLGNIEKNLQVSGLVILEQGSSVQGGTTITAAPGTVFVMRGAMDINWSNVILNQENGLPVAFIAGSDRRLILSNDNKPLRNLMIYSEYMWEFPSISGNVMDSCIFIGNSSEREKSHFYPGFRKISNSIIVNSLTGANVLEKTQNCMFVDCNLGLSKQQSGQNIEIPCWLVGSPLPEELKKALWVDANRVTLKVNPGRPTLPYAAEAGRLLPALKAIADKHQVPRR